MEMTTPVFTRQTKSEGKKMDMTTPVITRRVNLSLLFVLYSLMDGLSVLHEVLFSVSIISHEQKNINCRGRLSELQFLGKDHIILIMFKSRIYQLSSFLIVI